MPTALSSTEAARTNGPGPLERRWREARRSMGDLRALLEFRAAGVRGRSRRLARIGAVAVLVASILAAWLPAYLPAGTRRTDVLSLFPSLLVGVLVIAIISAAASGGGRELVPREQAVAFPVTPTTDHLGALLMAPLNIAWLLQSWLLLGAAAYVVGPRPGLALTQVVVVLWLAAATALAQIVGWAMEWVRRGPGGKVIVRVASLVVGGVAALVVASGSTGAVLERTPTVRVAIGALSAGGGPTMVWAQTAGELLVVTVVAIVTGAFVAGAVSRRQPREELRLETSSYMPRSAPLSDLQAMLRVDRVGIWRSVPLRRGLMVLAVMPGLVAVAGGLEWGLLTILPGLVASGGALLFGVNSWCLDGRGALWRDSLPAEPRLLFLSRVLVLLEVLLVATAGTVALASLRAGLPSLDQFAAVACAAVVVVLQVVSASLRWSVRRPFAVDLRSARATPAPPLVMVGYSARLALSTTFVGLVFSVLATVSWEWSVLVALPFVLFSVYRLTRTAGAWANPDTRCRVVTTVAS